MKKILLLISLFAIGCIAQTDFKKTGTTGFDFLKIPVSARTSGMADNSIALSDVNAEGTFTNPASIGFTTLEHSVFISYAQYIADIKHYAAAYTYSSELGVFGVNAVAMDYGSMIRTQVPTSGSNLYDILGTYNAQSTAFGLTYSKKLTDKFGFGVQFKYVKETIAEYSASNLVFDGGMLYYTGLSSLRIAATIQNFGVNSKFINDEFKMPTLFKIGAACEVIGDFQSMYRLTLSTEVLHPNDGNERINAGAEFAWNNMIMLRGGYKFFYDEESFSFGLGVNPQLPVPMTLDFGYSDYGRLGNVLRFSFQFGIIQ